MDIIGRRFNRWLVLRATDRRSGRQWFYECRCECGTIREVRKDQLTRGVSKSCGCWKAEVASAQITRLSTKHGMANQSRAYSIWKGMRKRVNNPVDKNYKHYGGRGISICKRWDHYENFLADMGDPPDGHTLDRINNEGNYEPKNCRWADSTTQMNNMRTNVLIRHAGKTLTIKEWSRELNIPYQRLYQRLFVLSWPISRSFRP